MIKIYRNIGWEYSIKFSKYLSGILLVIMMFCVSQLTHGQACCSTPMSFPAGNFETTNPAPNNQFNDTFAGFPSSFLRPTGSNSGITGNTAVPNGFNMSDTQSPGNKANLIGGFYVNTPSNKFFWARGNNICISALGVSLGTINPCHKYKICFKAGGWSPSVLNNTSQIPDGKTKVKLEANFVRFAGGNVKIEKSVLLNAATNLSDVAYQTIEFEFTTPNNTVGVITSFAMTVDDANDGAIFDDFVICDLGASTSGECTVASCVLPGVSPANANIQEGTCNGATTNNDAQIVFSGMSNTDKAGRSEGTNYSGVGYGGASNSGSSITFSGLKHDTNYTFRFFNGSAGCFVDIVLKTPAKTCVPVCTPPNPTSEGSTICSGSAATLTSSGCDATYISKWYSDAGLTNEVGSGSSFTTLTLTMTTDYYVACVKDATCKSSSVKVTATVVEKPTISGIPTVTQATCNQAGTAANNDAKIEITGIQNGTNYSVDGGAGISLTGGSITLANLPNPAATKVYTIRIFNSAATDCFMEFTATLEPKVCTPTCTPPSVSGQGATICAGSSATLTASGCTTGFTAKWFDNETATGTALQSGNSFTTPSLSSSTDYYVICEKDGDATCKSSSVKVTATVVEKPTISGIPTVTQATCNQAGTAANNDAKIEITGIQNGSSYTVDGGASQTLSGNAILLENLPNPAATKVYIIRILNSAATDCFMEFTATLEPKVCTPTCTPPSVSGQGATICAGTSATLTASGCDATYVLKWFSDAGLSNEITTGTNGNNLTTGVLATTTDYYAACVKDASCKSAGAKITATVVEKPTVSVNNGFPACRSNGTAYTIKFTATPAGSVVTAINVATGAGITVTGDSVANVPLTVAKIRLIVANGICRDSIEATAPVCDRPVGSIGDFIFKDINDNGLQDLPAEKGVLGVKLNLYAATGGTKTGSVLQTKTTTNEGKYLFSNLPAGSYIVEIDKTTLPDTCAITTKKDVNANANDETDSDFDATSGLSQVVELAPVFNPTTAAEVLATNNLTVDAGLVKVVLCPKPSYTITTAPNCSANNATYSVSIQITGKLGTVKASAGTISGNNPYTITGIPTGMSLKITDSLSSVCKSDTTIMGPNCNCSPKEPVLLNTSFNVCIGDTFPTLRAMVVGAATVEWFANATGGMAVATGLTYKPEGTVTAAGATFYAQARSTDASCPSATSTSREPASINAQNCAVEIDLALKKFINTKTAKLGDELTYTIKVFNQLDVAATGVEVTDSIATSVQFVAGSFIASRGSASIVGNVIKWNIGDIAASPDTVTLTYKVKAIQQGVHFNTAEISKTNEKDKDSTPNNGKDAEDDLDRQCFTVPIQLCAGEKVEASVPAKYTGVRWFKGGQEQTELAGQNVVLLGDVGSYTFTATNQTCPSSGCCPIIIEPGENCCPTNNCVPFTINRGKKK